MLGKNEIKISSSLNFSNKEKSDIAKPSDAFKRNKSFHSTIKPKKVSEIK